MNTQYNNATRPCNTTMQQDHAAQSRHTADVVTEAMSQAIARVTERITTLLLEGLDMLKAEMKTHVDKAIATAKGGLDKLSTAIKEIPPKIKTAVDSLCQLLPAGDLQAVCTTNVAGVIKNATGVAGVICQKGVNALVAIADKGLAIAADAVGEQVKKLGGACTSAASALPLEEAKAAIGVACQNVSEKLATMPKELLGNSTKEVNVSLSGVCTAIKSLKARHTPGSFEQLHMHSEHLPALAAGEPMDEPGMLVVAHRRQQLAQRRTELRLQQLSRVSVVRVQVYTSAQTCASTYRQTDVRHIHRHVCTFRLCSKNRRSALR